MQVVLVHHADAVGPEVDPQRPLSERGHAQADDVARALRALAIRPAAIWHSGKLRARQTGEAVWRTCAPFAEFRMVRGLGPDDPPSIAVDAVRAESRDLVLVGHRPNIGLVLHALIGPSPTDMPVHGAAVLLSDDDGVTWRCESTWKPDGT